VPAEFLNSRAGAGLVEEWHEYLRAMPVSHALLVGEKERRAVGFIRFGPADDARSEPSGDAEIYGFYVAPARIGKGVGRALFTAALDRLRKQGYRRVVLWTFIGNGPAERFYTRAGLKPDGATRIEAETGVGERRWRSDL
jgi:GNAT superfamily N-acetyltransferase